MGHPAHAARKVVRDYDLGVGMTTRFVILLFALFGSLSFAHADVIFSGNVSTGDSSSGSQCSASGAGNPLKVSCGGDVIYSEISGSGDAFSGSMSLHYEGAPEFTPGYETPAAGGIELQFDETYVLVGGYGATTVEFNVDPAAADAGFIPQVKCSVSFDGGAAQSCGFPMEFPDLFGMTFSETVEYGTPFSVDLEATIFGSTPDEPGDGYFSYYFEQQGLQVLTPEPSSILLLMPGMAGVFFVVRSRGKSRSAKA
jgi:hypothetical protein